MDIGAASSSGDMGIQTLVPAIQSFQEAGSYQFPAVEDFPARRCEWADGTDFVFALLDGIFRAGFFYFLFLVFDGAVTEAHILSELAGRYGEFHLFGQALPGCRGSRYAVGMIWLWRGPLVSCKLWNEPV